jgi:DNA-binding NarL/FixJ family response regulator
MSFHSNTQAASLPRVLIAEDHALMRDGIRALLHGHCELVGEAADGDAVIKLAIATRPDIILLDIGMPGIDGLEAAYILAKKVPASKILILSQHTEEEYVFESLGQARVAGFFVKDDSSDELLSAIKAVHGGRKYVSSSIAPLLVRQFVGDQKQKKNALTRRERQILKRIGDGESSKTIAAKLGIAPKTVQIHRGNIMAKLKVGSTVALVRYAIKHKLLRVD